MLSRFFALRSAAPRLYFDERARGHAAKLYKKFHWYSFQVIFPAKEQCTVGQAAGIQPFISNVARTVEIQGSRACRAGDVN